ncbi:MAG: Fur family transcriptional regulator [bacterium]|nr:Fur family transcriptional regulator [bacterium]
MTLTPSEMQQRMNRFGDALRRSGVKLTHQRMEIYREVARTGDHPDAETVYRGVRKRIPTVSLDTVYRTLWLLMDLGLITTLGSPRGSVRFDANMSSHCHYLCTRCGMARDFHSEEFAKFKIPDAVKALGSVEGTHVEFRGLCSSCSKKKG